MSFSIIHGWKNVLSTSLLVFLLGIWKLCALGHRLYVVSLAGRRNCDRTWFSFPRTLANSLSSLPLHSFLKERSVGEANEDLMDFRRKAFTFFYILKYIEQVRKGFRSSKVHQNLWVALALLTFFGILICYLKVLLQEVVFCSQSRYFFRRK